MRIRSHLRNPIPITPPIPRLIQNRNILSTTQTPHPDHRFFLIRRELRATPRYRQGLAVHARVVGEGAPEVCDCGVGPPFLVRGAGGPVDEPDLGLDLGLALGLGLGLGCWGLDEFVDVVGGGWGEEGSEGCYEGVLGFWGWFAGGGVLDAEDGVDEWVGCWEVGCPHGYCIRVVG